MSADVMERYVKAVIEEKTRRLEQACWDYICKRMLHPEDCQLIYTPGLAWPVAIVAEGYPMRRLDLN